MDPELNPTLGGSCSVRETAAAWRARLGSEGCSAETQDSFKCWLAESPQHRAAYHAVDQAWSRLQGCSREPEILALRHEMALRLTRRPSPAVHPSRWAVAAVVLLIAGVSITLAFRYVSDHSEFSLVAWVRNAVHIGGSSHYATGTGEQLAFTLEDGSKITLDTQSELIVAFTSDERVVQLVRGQAYFEVAKNRRRPFAVEAQDRRLVAVGTAFDVRLDGERMQVTLVEGKVRVEHRDSVATGPSPPAEIASGEQLVVDASRQDQVSGADLERSTSWRRGQIIFQSTRLEEAIAEINRYSDEKIELADPELAELRLSGAFATGHPTVFVEAISTYYAIRATREGRHIVLLRKKQ